MAHKKGVGSSRNGRESNAQRLGVKRFGGEQVLYIQRRARVFIIGTNMRVGIPRNFV